MGVYYGNTKHTHNRNGLVFSRRHTAYRGELRGVAHVISTAKVPTEVVTDCKAVERQVQKMIYQHSIDEEV